MRPHLPGGLGGQGPAQVPTSEVGSKRTGTAHTQSAFRSFSGDVDGLLLPAGSQEMSPGNTGRAGRVEKGSVHDTKQMRLTRRGAQQSLATAAAGNPGEAQTGISAVRLSGRAIRSKPLKGPGRAVQSSRQGPK